MRHLFRLTIFTFIVLSFLSCKKEDEVIIDDTKTTDGTTSDTDNTGDQNIETQGKNYYPTTFSTKYIYNSSLYNNYSTEFVGTEKVNGVDYATAKTIADNSTIMSKALSNNTGVTTIASVANGGELVLKLIDYSKALNESWTAGTIEVAGAGTVTKTTYTATLTNKFTSLAVNGVVYDDVIEVSLVTSMVYSLSAQYIALVGADFAEIMQENLNASATDILQKTYYANNVGMIEQISVDQPTLNVDLESKNF